MTNVFKTALFAAALVASSTTAQAITYTFDRAVGEGNVSGFITTDGTLGELRRTNIIDFDLTWSSATGASFNSTFAGGFAPSSNLQGNNFFTATQSDLTLSGTGTSLSFNSDTNDAAYFIDLGLLTSENREEIFGNFPDNSFFREKNTISTNFIFASVPVSDQPRPDVPVTDPDTPAAVPLPAGLPLIALGLGALGLMGRKRRT